MEEFSISDEQIAELAKLEKGCAAVYQNDWEEAVLCQFGQYHKSKEEENNNLDNELYIYNGYKKIETQSQIKIRILKYLIDHVLGEEPKELNDDISDIEQKIKNLSICYSLKQCLLKSINKRNIGLNDISSIVVSLFDCEGAIEKAKNSNSIDEWNNSIVEIVNPEIKMIPQYYIDNFIQCLMIEQSKKNPDFRPYAEKWVEYMKEVR